MARFIAAWLPVQAIYCQQIEYYLDLAAQTEAIVFSQISDKWQKCENFETPAIDDHLPSILTLPKLEGQSLDIGSGVNYENGNAKQSPFDMKDYAKQTAKSAESDKIA